MDKKRGLNDEKVEILLGKKRNSQARDGRHYSLKGGEKERGKVLWEGGVGVG